MRPAALLLLCALDGLHALGVVLTEIAGLGYWKARRALIRYLAG